MCSIAIAISSDSHDNCSITHTHPLSRIFYNSMYIYIKKYVYRLRIDCGCTQLTIQYDNGLHYNILYVCDLRVMTDVAIRLNHERARTCGFNFVFRPRLPSSDYENRT